MKRAGEWRESPAKRERRARESRREDGTVRTVSVSEPAILFACDTDGRLHLEKLPEFANSHRELRASNYFSARIRFAWLRFARDLPKSECWDASNLLRCKHAWRALVILACGRVPDGRLRRRFDLVDLAREKQPRRTLCRKKTKWRRLSNVAKAKLSASRRDAAGGTWGRLGQ